MRKRLLMVMAVLALGVAGSAWGGTILVKGGVRAPSLTLPLLHPLGPS